LLPAIFGTFTVPLVYLLLRQLGASRTTATFGACAVLLDNALLVESRFILLDGFLIFFGLSAITLYLAARRCDGQARGWRLATSAFLAGCALSVKWTGASALGVILAAWFTEAMRRRPALPRAGREGRRAPILREGAILVGIPIAVYVASFGVHFGILTHSGPGNTQMSARFQSQLIGAVFYDPAVHMSLWEKLQAVHHSIRYGNASLEHATHAGASPWYTWPIMKHPIGLWVPTGQTGADRQAGRAMIILLGNPVVWWGGLIGVLVGLATFLCRRELFAQRGQEYGFLFLLGALLLNFAPFAAITRLMYLYHYLFALIFVIALATYSTGILGGWTANNDQIWRFPSRRSAVLYWGLLGLAVLSFIYFLPFTYGWPLSNRSWDMHFWVLHPL
jgi:dolichyl-phosphate-mannose--protein O-mannosyl transferase